MKKNSCFILLLFIVISSCKKEKPYDDSYSINEDFPPGWQAFKTSYDVSFTGITLNHSDDIWCYDFKHLYKMTGADFTDYSAAISRSLTFNSNMSSLAVDKNNHLWVAVNNLDDDPSSAGLIKYDGTTFQTYTVKNSGIYNNKVMNVVIDSKDVKWLGTTNSLVNYDGITWSYYDASNSPLREYYPLLSAFGSIWITGRHSLKKVDGTSFVNWDASNSSFPASGMLMADADQLGNIWFLSYTDKNLWKFNGSTFSSFEIPSQYIPSTAYFKMIKVDASNNIWIGGEGKLVKFNGTNWTNYPVPFYTVTVGDPRIPHPEGPVQAAFLKMIVKSDSSKWLLEANFSGKRIMTFHE